MSLLARIAALEHRVAQMMQHGPVAQVDAAKGRVRLRLGGSDEQPLLGPWIPYAQQAGALKIHSPPTVGQQMVAFSPGGEPRQAIAVASTWSDQNQAPSDKGDENVITFGPWRIEMKSGAVNITGPKIKITGDVEITGSADVNGGTLKHDGKNVGKNHKHSGVQAGAAQTGDPV